jgi:hypothetical protein
MCSEYVPSTKLLRGALLMRTIFKHKRAHKDHKEQINVNTKSDTEAHVKLKDSALMDYYMMGGY